jgi:hypothetical protein
MRCIFLIVISCSFCFCCGQVVVKNESPHVAMDFKKYLYVGFQNPIYITTGNIKSLRVSTDNGSITATGKKGHYLIKPRKSGTATITLSGQNYKKTFAFDVWHMQSPTIRMAGFPNDDGMIDIKRSSTGIIAYHEPVDVDIEYQIDSFTITFRYSRDTTEHVNIGAVWDSTTKEMIRTAKSGSTIAIDKVYMSRNGRRIYSVGYLDYYVW